MEAEGVEVGGGRRWGYQGRDTEEPVSRRPSTSSHGGRARTVGTVRDAQRPVRVRQEPAGCCPARAGRTGRQI
jgi:hypothetical protein